MPVQTLSFYEINGTYIQLSGLSEHVNMYMFYSRQSNMTAITAGTLAQSAVYNPLENIHYSSVVVEPRRSKLFKVPETENLISSGEGIHVQVNFIHLLFELVFIF